MPRASFTIVSVVVALSFLLSSSLPAAQGGPHIASPSDPPSGGWVPSRTPTLAWRFLALDDSDFQTAFEVEVATDANFTDVVVASAPVSSNETAWEVPAPGLAAGNWSWRVRAADSNGTWSSWLASSFGVDLEPPEITMVRVDKRYTDGGFVGYSVCWLSTDAASGVGNATVEVEGVSNKTVGTGAGSCVGVGRPPPGTYRVRLWVRDRVNHTGFAETTFTVTDPWSENAWILGSAVVAVVATIAALFFWRRRRRRGRSPKGAPPSD